MRPTRSEKAYMKSSLIIATGVVFVWQQWVSPLVAQSANAQANKVPPLQIVVLAGEDGVNIIKAKKAALPVVEVRDKDRRPLAGLYVTFTAPDSGPRVTFASGSSIYSTVTDANGRAAVHDMKPVGQGAFKINVETSFQGQTATTAIAQTNYLTVGAASAGGGAAAAGTSTATGGGKAAAAGGVSKTVIAVIVAGVAAGAGAAVALSKKGGGSQTSSTPSGTIGGVGTGTIGPPH